MILKFFLKSMLIITLAITLFFISACDTLSVTKKGEQLYQVSTIDALLAGLYDGDLHVSDVQQNGDFGLGTFDGIDGEMIVHDGTVYQVLSTGAVVKADVDMGVPFASVHHFLSDFNTTLKEIKSYDALKLALNSYTQCKNYPCAFKIQGTFNYIKARSAPKASKPYPPLAEYITENQNFFTSKNINGTLIGYSLPGYFKQLNVSGYHFHFISDDKKFGGHVLELVLKDASLELDRLFDVRLKLLRTSEFEKSTLQSQENDLDKVEK